VMNRTRVVCRGCESNKIFPIHTVFSWITRNEFSGLTRREDRRSRYKNPQIWLGGDSFACYFGCLECDEITELRVAGDRRTEDVDYFCEAKLCVSANPEFVDFLKEESKNTKKGGGE